MIRLFAPVAEGLAAPAESHRHAAANDVSAHAIDASVETEKGVYLTAARGVRDREEDAR